MYDVLIVGAGLGGATAAAVLSRAGCRVVAVDRHAAYPADFRAEQLVVLATGPNDGSLLGPARDQPDDAERAPFADLRVRPAGRIAP